MAPVQRADVGSNAFQVVLNCICTIFGSWAIKTVLALSSDPTRSIVLSIFANLCIENSETRVMNPKLRMID